MLEGVPQITRHSKGKDLILERVSSLEGLTIKRTGTVVFLSIRERTATLPFIPIYLGDQVLMVVAGGVLDQQGRPFQSWAAMDPSRIAVLLLPLTMTSLLLLSGCEGMLPTESNTPGAVVPNPQPGAPIAGGLRIVSAHATPWLITFRI